MVTAEANSIAWTAAPGEVRPGMPEARFFAIAVVLIAAGVVLFFAPAFEQPSAGAAWVAFGVLTLAALAVRWTMVRQGLMHWIALPSTISYYFLYRFGIGALVIYYWDRFPWVANPGLTQRFFPNGARQNLGEGSFLILLGGLGLCLGMLLPAKAIAERLPHLTWQTNERFFRRNVALYLPIALLLTASASSVPASARFLVTILGSVLYVFVALATYWLFTSEGRGRYLWLVMLLGTVAVAILIGTSSGSVGELLVPFPMMLVGYIAARRRVPWLMLSTALAAAFFFVFPYLSAYKASTDQLVNPLSLERRMSVATEILANTDYRDALEMTINRFVARMALAEFPAVYSRFYPDVYPYDDGRSLAIELGSLVPRVAWPDKPEMSIALNEYARHVGIVRMEDNNSAVFDAVSEYYLNFGPVGVFLLCAVHGFYVSLIYAWMVQSFGELMASVIGAGLFLLNLDFFGIGQIFVTQLKVLPVWIAMLYVLSRRWIAEEAA